MNLWWSSWLLNLGLDSFALSFLSLSMCCYNNQEWFKKNRKRFYILHVVVGVFSFFLFFIYIILTPYLETWSVGSVGEENICLLTLSCFFFWFYLVLPFPILRFSIWLFVSLSLNISWFYIAFDFKLLLLWL